MIIPQSPQYSEAEAEAASRANSEFIANMSDDIRTPVSEILARSEHMLHDADALSDPEQLRTTVRADIPMLSEATHSLLSLCNDILDTVQLASGHSKPCAEVFDLQALLLQSITLLRPVARDKIVGRITAHRFSRASAPKGYA